MTRILTVVTVLGVLWLPSLALADLKNDINNALNRRQTLQESISHAEKDKGQQRQVAKALQSEIDSLNRTISTTEAAITAISHDVTLTENSIRQLEVEINQQVALLEAERSKLETAIANMYIDGGTSPILLLAGDTISDVVTDLQGYQAIEIEIDKKAQFIEELKIKLEQHKIDLEKKRAEQLTLREQQNKQKEALNQQKSLKDTLLSASFATIAKLEETIKGYQNEIKAVDGRISEFEEALKTQQGYQAADGDIIVNNSPRWYVSQTDPRWASDRLDPTSNGSDTFAESGCLITSVTMVAARYGFALKPPQVLQKLIGAGSMYGDLLAWSGVSKSFEGQLDFGGGGKEPFNVRVVDGTLANGGMVIVHINPEGRSRYGHWGVIWAKLDKRYIMADPYFQNGRVYPASWLDMMARLQPSVI